MIDTKDRKYTTNAGFTLAQLREAADYLWRVLPRNTGMPDAADCLLGYIRRLETMQIMLPADETVTLIKAWVTDQLIVYETTPRARGWNAYDMAHTLFYKMFLAMTARQYPSLVTAQMVYYSILYQLTRDPAEAPMTAAYRAVLELVKERLDTMIEGKSEKPIETLRKQCLADAEECLQPGHEEEAHAYIFVLALFH